MKAAPLAFAMRLSRFFKLLIVDLRAAAFSLSYLDGFSFIQSHRQALPEGTQVAVLMRTGERDVVYEAIEAATSLAGFPQEQFFAEKDALAWLAGDSPHRAPRPAQTAPDRFAATQHS